jgi:hypothetical protein
VPAPRVFSAVTLMASAFVNESLENKGFVGFNTDCIADIWVFDIGGMILFSFDWPNRFFSHTIVIADWSLQPSFTLPNGELHNVGNYFAAKWALPFYRRLSLFAWYGEATTAGSPSRSMTNIRCRPRRAAPPSTSPTAPPRASKTSSTSSPPARFSSTGTTPCRENGILGRSRSAGVDGTGSISRLTRSDFAP